MTLVEIIYARRPIKGNFMTEVQLTAEGMPVGMPKVVSCTEVIKVAKWAGVHRNFYVSICTFRAIK